MSQSVIVVHLRLVLCAAFLLPSVTLVFGSTSGHLGHDLRLSEVRDESSAAAAAAAAAYGPSSAVVEPPRRPTNFRNIDELNQYLAEMKKYYSILGRPRFGRRKKFHLLPSYFAVAPWDEEDDLSEIDYLPLQP